ncbi:MAG: hypothetical protein HRU37_12930, partial [Roseibacillus sp.]|nr:hypothetical protein [Roseibacillus sp.]
MNTLRLFVITLAAVATALPTYASQSDHRQSASQFAGPHERGKSAERRASEIFEAGPFRADRHREEKIRHARRDRHDEDSDSHRRGDHHDEDSDSHRRGDRHDGDRNRPPKARLRLKNLTRDRDALNWIRLDARRSKGRKSPITSYVYAVKVKDTGRYVHAPAATESPVAHVRLPPGEYSASVTVSDSLGARRTRTRRLHIRGDEVRNRRYGNIEWALDPNWKLGDESILISHPSGVIPFQFIREIFNGGPRGTNPQETNLLLKAASSGCGSVLSNGGNGIGIVTGFLAFSTAGASTGFKAAVGGISGLANAAGAGAKISGGKAKSSCFQNELDAINQQLAYQEEQIQDLYSIIGRDEEAFFSALQAISAITNQLVTISYTDAKETLRTDFNNFMIDAGLWDGSLDPSGPWLTELDGTEIELDLESVDLVACTNSETACCVYPEEDP